jgi:hypothetical protein
VIADLFNDPTAQAYATFLGPSKRNWADLSSGSNLVEGCSFTTNSRSRSFAASDRRRDGRVWSQPVVSDVTDRRERPSLYRAALFALRLRSTVECLRVFVLMDGP